MKTRTRLLIAAAIVLGLMLGSLGVSYAITYGVPDGDGHPYVGMVLLYDGADEYIGRCTGTLLSPTVVLTAGHCTVDAARAVVLFDPDLSQLVYPYPDCGPYACYEGTPIAHPEFAGLIIPDTHDVGVVLLNAPVAMGTYGALPELHVLDDLATQRGQQDLVVRTVGYGRQEGKPDPQSDRVRYTSTSMIVNLRSHLTDGYNLHTSNNPGQGHGTSGGSCFGDSGGPIFYPADSNVVVGIVSFGMNGNCKGADWGYRVDIEDTQDFVRPFLP